MKTNRRPDGDQLIPALKLASAESPGKRPGNPPPSSGGFRDTVFTIVPSGRAMTISFPSPRLRSKATRAPSGDQTGFASLLPGAVPARARTNRGTMGSGAGTTLSGTAAALSGAAAPGAGTAGASSAPTGILNAAARTSR